MGVPSSLVCVAFAVFDSIPQVDDVLQALLAASEHGIVVVSIELQRAFESIGHLG